MISIGPTVAIFYSGFFPLLIRAHGAVQVLDLLGTGSVHRSHQGHSSRQMAALLNLNRKLLALMKKVTFGEKIKNVEKKLLT